jgi:hypothetical protein
VNRLFGAGYLMMDDFPKTVARMCNRFYTFPNWRLQNRAGLVAGWNLANHYIIEPLVRD